MFEHRLRDVLRKSSSKSEKTMKKLDSNGDSIHKLRTAAADLLEEIDRKNESKFHKQKMFTIKERSDALLHPLSPHRDEAQRIAQSPLHLPDWPPVLLPVAIAAFEELETLAISLGDLSPNEFEAFVKERGPVQWNATLTIVKNNVAEIKWFDMIKAANHQAATNRQQPFQPGDETSIYQVFGGNRRTLGLPDRRKFCIICRTEVEIDELAVRLPCGDEHDFHHKCIAPCLLLDRRCPKCLNPVVEADTKAYEHYDY